MANAPIRGIVFDLDGTLVDSGLDFNAIRREMGLPPGQPILEALDHLDDEEAARCREILARHEWAGAERARLMPGVREFLDAIEGRAIRRAILTRNSRTIAEATLERLGLSFDPVVARDDAPAKPDPSAIWGICGIWGLDRRRVAMVGDFHFDIEAGRNAGVWTVLYTAGRPPDQVVGSDLADFHLECFARPEGLLAWLEEPI